MKKGNSILLMLLALSVTLVAIVISYGVINILLTGKDIGLNDEKFDALEDIDGFSLDRFRYELEESAFFGGLRLDGATAKVSLKEDVMTVSIISKSMEYINELVLNENILIANWYDNKTIDDITLKLFDMVYSMKHSSKNAISEYVSKTDASLFNLKNVGLEISAGKISMITNDDINFIDISSKYITIEDANKFKSKLANDEFVQLGNENIIALKKVFDKNIVISVGQYGKLSKPAYDSLVNVLAFVLNYNQIYENFVYTHTNYKLKNEENSDYRIEINPEKEEYEKKSLNNMEIIRMTIYK